MLHDKIDVPDKDKKNYADKFDDKYYGNEEDFITFINSDIFAVKGDYDETWEFIKKDGNSFKRYSNFHLFINDWVELLNGEGN